MTTSKLSGIVSPAFYDVHRQIRMGRVDEAVLEGGRGSTKSSFASVELVLLLIRHPDCHAVVMRQVANTLRTSVYAQICWAVTALGLTQKFKCTVSPMECTYLPTGQKIMFFGLDDPGNLKSIKLPFGYVAYVHFEELDQFRGPEEVRNVEQSLLRGGPIAITFKSFNPPASAANWANQYARESKPGQVKHHSTYLETPPEWLGPRFIADAEHLKALRPMAYRNEYLGEVTGGGANVFENIQLRAITDEELGRFDRYYPDPWAYNCMHYDAARLTLYIFDEAEAYRKGNEETARILREEKGVQPLDLLTADSAEPKSIGDYKAFGLYCRGAAKPPGSVEYSMKWLGRLAAIVIDPERCPRTAKEFSEYEFERDKDGNLISAYPDAKNHHIDAVRYGMQPVWKQRGE